MESDTRGEGSSAVLSDKEAAQLATARSAATLLCESGAIGPQASDYIVGFFGHVNRDDVSPEMRAPESVQMNVTEKQVRP